MTKICLASLFLLGACMVGIGCHRTESTTNPEATPSTRQTSQKPGPSEPKKPEPGSKKTS